MDKSVDLMVRKFRGTRWHHINNRTVNGKNPKWSCKQARFYLEKGIQVKMTKTAFYRWCADNSKVILKLYKEGKIPSIDRIDSNGNYEISNLQIIDYNENRRRMNVVAQARSEAAFASIPKRNCSYCGNVLQRKISRAGRQECLGHFKKRLTCGRSCAMFIQMRKGKL